MLARILLGAVAVAIVGGLVAAYFITAAINSFGGHAEHLFSYDVDSTLTVEYRGKLFTSRQFTHCDIVKVYGGIDRPGFGIDAVAKGQKPFAVFDDGSAGILSFNVCAWKTEPPAPDTIYTLATIDGRKAAPSAPPPANTLWTWGDFVWLDNAADPKFVKFGGLNAVADSQVEDFRNLTIKAKLATSEFRGTDLHKDIPYFAKVEALPSKTESDRRIRGQALALIVFGFAYESKINGKCASPGPGDPTRWIVVEAQQCGKSPSEPMTAIPGPNPALVTLAPVATVPYHWGVLANALPSRPGVVTAFGESRNWTETVCFEVCMDVAARSGVNNFFAFHQFFTDRMIQVGIGQARLQEIIRSDVTGW